MEKKKYNYKGISAIRFFLIALRMLDVVDRKEYIVLHQAVKKRRKWELIRLGD